jgi:hypothetical protein
VVTLLFEPDGADCVVTLIHRIDAAHAKSVPQTESGWAAMFDQIDGLQGTAHA